MMLLLANIFWGLSFPLIKAAMLAHRQVLPSDETWFVTAYALAPRFLLGALILLALVWRQARSLARLELGQGVLLGLASGAGMVFQNDGLQYTSASVSAFLTQFYAILIPVYVAVRSRRWPPGAVWLGGGLVLAGVAILGRFDFREMRLGRGEIETLLGSAFFMIQILLVENKAFAGNRPGPVTLVMFSVQAAGFALMALGTAPGAAALAAPWASWSWLGFTGTLAVFCTVGAYTIMNRWQPVITATEAGMIYCVEPVFASVMALFLPALFSGWAGFDYPNERVTWHLLLGGGLIMLANVLIQLRTRNSRAGAT